MLTKKKILHCDLIFILWLIPSDLILQRVVFLLIVSYGIIEVRDGKDLLSHSTIAGLSPTLYFFMFFPSFNEWRKGVLGNSFRDCSLA